MRLFWTIIALLALSTAAWWFLRTPEGLPPPPRAPEPGAPTPPDPRPVPPEAPEPTPAHVAIVAPKLADRRTPATAPAAAPAAQPVTPEKPAVADEPAPAPEPGATPARAATPRPPDAPPPTVAPDAASELDRLLGVTPEPLPEPPPHAQAPKPPASPAPASGAPVKLSRQDDGSTLVDDKYVIKGTGTKADPYRVTWEMLVSAQDTYQPRLGRKVIPERLKMIDGKWVRISGYIAFPIMSASPDEMLMMLNQWDGCCIGVPPTPYDAIEVKLKAAAKGDVRMRTTGTLTGLFKVDPYLVKDWLVSLFIMDNGELTDAAGEAPQGEHGK
ncbi:MAG TPA: hypothetical protein PKE29_14300 [Phycisphaerales bacterium]|nr:hypothetical protein [Phycisphaerales bacterium]